MVEFSSFGVFPRLLSFAVDYAFEETEGRRGGGRGTVVVVYVVVFDSNHRSVLLARQTLGEEGLNRYPLPTRRLEAEVLEVYANILARGSGRRVEEHFLGIIVGLLFAVAAADVTTTTTTTTTAAITPILLLLFFARTKTTPSSLIQKNG